MLPTDSGNSSPEGTPTTANAPNSYATTSETTAAHQVIMGVLLAGFHHKKGPMIEHVVPDGLAHQLMPSLPAEWSWLPFACLPDKAHLVQGEGSTTTFFHLPPLRGSDLDAPGRRHVYGLAVFRQIDSNLLTTNRPSDITRSHVQKSVVVLLKEPLLPAIKEKVEIVAKALFEQRDFTDLHVLGDLYEALCASIPQSRIPSADYYIGLRVDNFLRVFKQKVLVLFKALLLERRVLFYGQDIQLFCNFQYSLVSLFPSLIRSLGYPASDLNVFNLPLRIFGNGAVFSPYTPLQQLESIRGSNSFLAGSSNDMFLTASGADIIARCDDGTIEFANDESRKAVELTAPDRKFMDTILRSMIGQVEDIRVKFESYLFGLFRTVIDGSEEDITAYGVSFVSAWKKTRNYAFWREGVYPDKLLEVLVQGHPCTGATVLGEMQEKVTERLKELQLDKTVDAFRLKTTKWAAEVQPSLNRRLSHLFAGSSNEAAADVGTDNPKSSNISASNAATSIMSNAHGWWQAAVKAVTSDDIAANESTPQDVMVSDAEGFVVIDKNNRTHKDSKTPVVEEECEATQ